MQTEQLVHLETTLPAHTDVLKQGLRERVQGRVLRGGKPRDDMKGKANYICNAYNMYKAHAKTSPSQLITYDHNSVKTEQQNCL